MQNFPSPDRTTARIIDGLSTSPANFKHDPLPDISPEKIIRQGATSNERWQPQPNRQAGQREFIWFETHKHELVGYGGKWIAVVGQQVRAARDTFGEVRAYLDHEGIADALIVNVRENVAERQLFID